MGNILKFTCLSTSGNLSDALNKTWNIDLDQIKIVNFDFDITPPEGPFDPEISPNKFIVSLSTDNPNYFDLEQDQWAINETGVVMYFKIDTSLGGNPLDLMDAISNAMVARPGNGIIDLGTLGKPNNFPNVTVLLVDQEFFDFND